MAGSGGMQTNAQTPGTIQPIIAMPSWIGLLPANYFSWQKRYAVYTADFEGANVLPNSSNLTVPIQINNDSNFCVMVATAEVRSTDNTILYTYRPIKMQLNDSGANINLFINPVLLDNIAPPAATPFYWPMPYIINGGAVLGTTLTNLSTTVTYNVSVSFHGFKLYPVPTGNGS
jgi:hypothetical protein